MNSNTNYITIINDILNYHLFKRYLHYDSSYKRRYIKQITDDGYESVWLISNGTSEAEVYEYELS